MTLDDNVISIVDRVGSTEHPPVAVTGVMDRDCRHEHFWVDDKLRTVACRDCGQDRLDPLECLIQLARQWSRWEREIKALTDLRRQQADHERAKWERARDRHLNANPGHAVDAGRTSWVYADGRCRTCMRLEQTAPSSVAAKARSDAAFDRNRLEP